MKTKNLLTAAMLVAAVTVADEAAADLASDVATAVGQAVNELDGTGSGTISSSFETMGITVETRLLGFALCEPPDPLAPPVADPEPPTNAYGCENAAEVVADVAADATRAELTITVNDLFLDLETERDETILCGDGYPHDDTVVGAGYVLAAATLQATLALTEVDWCVQAEIVPGSVTVDLAQVEIDVEDSCLARFIDALTMVMATQMEAALGQAMTDVLVARMPAINASLCDLTPVEAVTWSTVKQRFR